MIRRWRDHFWSKGEPWNCIRSWLLPRLLRAVHSVLMLTLRFSVSGNQHIAPALDARTPPGALVVTWHDLTLVLLHLYRNKKIGVMMSRSRSGQIQAALWRLNGFPTVWGSTKKREGVQAVRETLQLLKTEQPFAFTPDGPKGPRHRAQPGVIYMASKAGSVIVPLGVAADRSWRLPTWDKYLIPQPFSRVHVHWGEPLIVPPNARDDMEAWQTKVESALNDATTKCVEALRIGA